MEYDIYANMDAELRAALRGISPELDKQLGEDNSSKPEPKPLSVKKDRPKWRVSNTLYMWRSSQNMTQADLANRVGVARQTIINIETGKNEPTFGLALAIAEVFDVSVLDIFRLQKKPAH